MAGRRSASREENACSDSASDFVKRSYNKMLQLPQISGRSHTPLKQPKKIKLDWTTQINAETQIPTKELPLEKAEELWYLDKDVRMEKQVWSLNQIWRFIDQELDRSGLI